MPANRRSARLTDRHRDELAQERAEALAVLAASWQALDREDLRGTFAVWLATAAAIVRERQDAGVTAAEAYLAAFIASELGDRLNPVPQTVDRDGIVGVDRFGRPLPEALRPSLMTVQAALAGGLALSVAMRYGLTRARRIAAEAMAAAPRLARHQLYERSSYVRGWRPVVTGVSSCGACLANADGRIRSYRERQKIHAACDCVAEPVIAGVTERFHRPTGEQLFRELTPDEQAKLFYGRGGAEKAKLLREGTVPFASLIAPDPREIGEDGITEAPLAALQ